MYSKGSHCRIEVGVTAPVLVFQLATIVYPAYVEGENPLVKKFVFSERTAVVMSHVYGTPKIKNN